MSHTDESTSVQATSPWTTTARRLRPTGKNLNNYWKLFLSYCHTSLKTQRPPCLNTITQPLTTWSNNVERASCTNMN